MISKNIFLFSYRNLGLGNQPDNNLRRKMDKPKKKSPDSKELMKDIIEDNSYGNSVDGIEELVREPYEKFKNETKEFTKNVTRNVTEALWQDFLNWVRSFDPVSINVLCQFL